VVALLLEIFSRAGAGDRGRPQPGAAGLGMATVAVPSPELQRWGGLP